MTMASPRGSLGRRLLEGGLLAASVIALLAVTVAMLRVAAERLLERDARHAALNWADALARSGADLPRLVQDRALDDATRAQLRPLAHVQDVLSFRLFDAQGMLLLASDELDALPAVLPPRLREAAAGGFAAAMAAGESRVRLQRGGPGGRTGLYAQAQVPLQHNGNVLGMAEVLLDQDEREQRILEAFATVAAAVFLLVAVLFGLFGWQWLRRMQGGGSAHDQAYYLSQYDALTGTLNRASFLAALTQAERRHAQGGLGFAVLSLDLDRFQQVNDTLGQDAGDEVLRQVGLRLMELVRAGDKVARLGSDEFAILQCSVQGAPDVVTLAQRVVDSLSRPFDVMQRQARCSASVGAALVRVEVPPPPDSMHGRPVPEDDEEPPVPAYAAKPEGPPDLLHQAGVALYRAKASGGGGFSFYDAALDLQLRQRRGLLGDLREAIARNQLSLHYQPVYRSEAGGLAGYEALLRWHHPMLGLVPPGDFIPLAEDGGLIDAIGRWVLCHACREAAGWPAQFSVAVNLAPAQFRSAGLVQEVQAALLAAGLAPDRLELEVAEALLTDPAGQVMATLQSLGALGLRIAVDGFGTGQSSLEHLWKLPFHKVKIDRRFIRNLEDDARSRLIVKSIIALAHSLQVRVNAGGVETPGQVATLQAYGCDEMQGYLLGRPAMAGWLPHQDPLVQPAGRQFVRPGMADAAVARAPGKFLSSTGAASA